MKFGTDARLALHKDNPNYSIYVRYYPNAWWHRKKWVFSVRWDGMYFERRYETREKAYAVFDRHLGYGFVEILATGI